MAQDELSGKTERNILSDEQRVETYTLADTERIEAALEELWRQGREQGNDR